ncbi:WD40 repeat domain-containing protein [Endozoicomonas sp. YOMI1]|uniref:WD40 repeat domain-containing protein n=1 Tax=Endozoicomonas sp. YOMI1 TaxID=2828739 RepID=UPI002149861A|nr:WD40 repeat domain-containing protein [Endozoicomonas sp. YOMI1]
MQPIAQSYLRSTDGSGLIKDEEALIDSLKPISGLVSNFNKRISEASETDQNHTIKRLKKDLPPGWTTSTDTDIDNRKLQIVGLNFSTNHLSPGTTSQQPDIKMIQCDSRIEPDNIDPTKSKIFQCQANCLELKLEASFGCYILDASFSPTGKNLLISGCDSLTDHSLVIWRQGADGNWSDNNRSRVGGSQNISFQLNRSENTLLSVSRDGNVKVSTLNSDGRWSESVVLAHTPHEAGYEPVMASFSPLQDKIMSFDPHTGKINVLREDGNSRWTLLNQLREIRQIGLTPLKFKATNNYLLTYNGTKATIWGCNDQSNCLENKFDMDCNELIEGCQMSNDERHALIFSHEGNQVFFLARDVNGNWSQVGEIRHSEQTANYRSVSMPNHIYTASFNGSGQYALTRDLAKKSIISGYDDNGAWVEKIEIPSCDYACFSASGRKVLASLGSGSFKIWDCNSTDNSLDKVQTLEHIGSDKAIFSPSENLLLSYGDQTNYACIWGDDEDGNLVEKARVCHQGGIDVAYFNVQEDSVLSVSRDCTVKIQWLDRDDEWRGQLMVQHQKNIDFAKFSSSERLAFTVSRDSTACILGRDDDGKWTKQATITIPDGYSIWGVHFNVLDNHFLIYGNKFNGKDHHKPGLVQLCGIGDDGKWVEKELITLDHRIKRAKFSPDGDHLMIHCENKLESVVPKGGTALLWKIPASPSA